MFVSAYVHFYCVRFNDKNRKTRMTLIIISLITIIGGMLYIVDSSYYFPIARSSLSGFQYFINTIAVGEIKRSYTREDTTYKLPVLQAGFFRCFTSCDCSICYERLVHLRLVHLRLRFKTGPFLIDYSNILVC